MKVSNNLKKENYTAVAEFMLVSFERDLSEFTKSFKTIDEEYLSKFKSAITDAKSLGSAMAIQAEQKNVTKKLYEYADQLKDMIAFLKRYAEKANLETTILGRIATSLRAKNIEKSVIDTRAALPYFIENKDKMTDMPEGFLDKIEPIIDNFEKLNISQNSLMNQRKQITSESKDVYQKLYVYISEIADMGKMIYKQSTKKDEYTISKILSRMSYTDKKKEVKAEMPKKEA
ncbi:hypothetical protein [Capnocytophaga catalasegens]|uniref:Uncharacterized protein n=1 Tax=Capnocytophaga catalasegens TaxID=1004260 RepID=A0AAV5AVK4_9FLAO|nr:hypothetical protein [Capnocytophaga catalasegens]GIZ16436.1 hypothetical protein RCZ03_24360 [Capnocytophaga catalasegens]GJM50325.1 hypothetical protein RCZ15_12980 [Capnocytophaga catalasegens]GJM53842.1 hypothetical protein RCZ16_21580 [Capnocytophaga catalasegens]